jgi:hypothetical protein
VVAFAGPGTVSAHLVGLFLEFMGHLAEPVGHRVVRTHTGKSQASLDLLPQIRGIRHCQPQLAALSQGQNGESARAFRALSKNFANSAINFSDLGSRPSWANGLVKQKAPGTHCLQAARAAAPIAPVTQRP